jgi:hypothetical protein
MFRDNLTPIILASLLLLGNVMFFSKGLEYETLYKQTQQELTLVERELAIYRETSNRD